MFTESQSYSSRGCYSKRKGRRESDLSMTGYGIKDDRSLFPRKWAVEPGSQFSHITEQGISCSIPLDERSAFVPETVDGVLHDSHEPPSPIWQLAPQVKRLFVGAAPDFIRSALVAETFPDRQGICAMFLHGMGLVLNLRDGLDRSDNWCLGNQVINQRDTGDDRRGDAEPPAGV